MKETFRNIGIAIIATVIIIGGTYTAIQWDAIVGKWETNAQREIHKETTAYNEAAAQFLVDSWKDYNDAESDADRATIMQYVVMRYPNLDYDNIDNPTLKSFYRDCINR